jgi:hypothetical protein
MYKLHCTKKLLDRIKPSTTSPDYTPSTVLGNWYATVLFWKPQFALFVNEKTLLPVLIPLAPATNIATLFPDELANVLTAHGVPKDFIEHERSQMSEAYYAKTANRSVVGIMNEFSYLAEVFRDYHETGGLLTLSLKLSETPCSPLYKSMISPDRELKRVVGEWQNRNRLK